VGLCAVFLTACPVPEPEVAPESLLLVRMALESGRDHPTAAASREVARLAREASDGRIRIRVYEDGYLGDESEVVEQLLFGGIDLAAVSVRALEALSPAAADLGRAGRFASTADMRVFLDGSGAAALSEELASERLMFLSWYDGGPECYLLPPSAAGIQSLRIGVERSKTAMAQIAALSAVPVPLAAREMRRSLEAGMVDGIRAPLSFVLANRLDRDYPVFPLSHSRCPVLIIGSRVALMKLPANDRTLLLEAVKASRIFHADALAFMETRFFRDAAYLQAAPAGGP